MNKCPQCNAPIEMTRTWDFEKKMVRKSCMWCELTIWEPNERIKQAIVEMDRRKK